MQKRTPENKIRFNVISVYVFIAVVCGGMILYVYNLRNNVGVQKEKIDKYNDELVLINELIQTVHRTQSTINLYISSRGQVYFSEFEEFSSAIEQLMDSLEHISESTSRHRNFEELKHYLKEHKDIVSELSKQFSLYNPLDSIIQKLQDYQSSKLPDSMLLIPVKRDTVYQQVPEKKFWQRLAYLFSPKRHTDSLLTVSSSEVDTIMLKTTDILSVLSDIQNLSMNASRNYTLQLDNIKHQISTLIYSDQVISSQISDLLLDIHSETIGSISEEIKKSEQMIRRNYILLFIFGTISLILILILIILIIQDVNKGHEDRKALEEANSLTQRLMEERHKLLLSVSHDIKAPLSSILGYLELWQLQEHISEDEQSRISSMENSANYTLSLLQNLLDFSKLEKGSVQIVSSHFNIHQLCLELTEMFTPLAAQKALTFAYKPTIDRNLQLYSDRLKIKQIIANILSNAVKYTLSGGIEFCVSYANDTLLFAIHDTGVGIPQDQIENVFKPFSRIEKSTSLAEGSGFGLYVVKGLVEALNGDVRVIPKKEIGTTLEVRIPMRKTTENAIPDASQTPSSLVVNKKHKILVIDDDELFLSIVKEMLCKLEQEVDTCNTLSDFEKLLPNISQYDMIITDRYMGAFSGVDTLQKVRHLDQSIPVWLMSGHSAFDGQKALSEGFDGFLLKPFTIQHLAALLSGISSPEEKNLLFQEQNDYMLFLKKMFKGDQEIILNILNSFVQSVCDNILLLREAVLKDDFSEAQSICHKTLGTFRQLNIVSGTETLKKMDAARDREYENWQEEINQLIECMESLADEITNKHLENGWLK